MAVSRDQEPISDRPQREPPNQLYVLSEERQPSRTGSTSFTRVDSAIAFPRSLGLSLGADDAPKLQAFAWNTGTRAEAPAVVQPSIFEYISYEDIEKFSLIFFTSINPVFGLLTREDFNRRIIQSWETQSIDAGLEVVLCGTIALGSLFSTPPFTHEPNVVEQARLTLDKTIAHTGSALLSLDFVHGWLLRALYLRCTANPHVSWLASSIALHIAESIGLHQEMRSVKTATRTQSRVLTDAEIESRRKTFWVACSLNRLFAAQYGRSKINLQNVSCRYPGPDEEEDADDFIGLIRLMPDLCDATTLVSMPAIAPVTEALLSLARFRTEKEPLLLLRADCVFCVYRKMRHVGLGLSGLQSEAVISVIRAALVAADSLARQRHQWWMIIGVPFHSLCVLLALNTLDSLTLLQGAMETLQRVVGVVGSDGAREALRTAHGLVKGTEGSRRRELECLQRCVNLNAQVGEMVPVVGEVPAFEWPTDFELGFAEYWDTGFLEGDVDVGIVGV